LVSLTLGKLEISNFEMGDKGILDDLPQWDENEMELITEFQLPTLIESIGKLIRDASSKNELSE